MEGRVIKLEGNPVDPISQGAICARGQAALQGLYNPDRLGKPNTRARRRHSHGDSLGRRDQANQRQSGGGGQGRQGSRRFYRRFAGADARQIDPAWAQAFNSTRVGFWEAVQRRAGARGC